MTTRLARVLSAAPSAALTLSAALLLSGAAAWTFAPRALAEDAPVAEGAPAPEIAAEVAPDVSAQPVAVEDVAADAVPVESAIEAAVERSTDAAPEPGPALGATIADAFTLNDASGAARDFASLTGESGLVVYVNRSLDWCPFCIKQTIDLAPRASDFADRGYGLAVVTIDAADALAAASAKHGLAVTLLGDPDRTFVKALNLVDPQFADESKHPAGSFAYALPYPVALVLDGAGVVQAKVFAADVYGEDNAYRTRVTVDDVLAALPTATEAPTSADASAEAPAVEPTEATTPAN